MDRPPWRRRPLKSARDEERGTDAECQCCPVEKVIGIVKDVAKVDERQGHSDEKAANSQNRHDRACLSVPFDRRDEWCSGIPALPYLQPEPSLADKEEHHKEIEGAVS